MKPLSAYARAAALGFHVVLILLWVGTAESLLGSLLPLLLLLPLPGLVRGHTYTYGWASLLLSFICAGLLAEGVADPARQLLWWTLASLAALDFSAVVLYVRFTQRERIAQRESSNAAAP